MSLIFDLSKIDITNTSKDIEFVDFILNKPSAKSLLMSIVLLIKKKSNLFIILCI